MFRIVTALAPPFVMESELDEDGLCLRGLPCHRVSPVGMYFIDAISATLCICISANMFARFHPFKYMYTNVFYLRLFGVSPFIIDFWPCFRYKLFVAK